MKLVIEIDEDYYDLLKHGVYCGDDYVPIKIIVNGTPLPKGHGDLIDRDRAYEFSSIEDMPAIIEADKESEDKNDTDKN